MLLKWDKIVLEDINSRIDIGEWESLPKLYAGKID